MNITTQATVIPVPTVTNPSTEALRRENVQREVITQPAAAQQSAKEKGAPSERERARTPAQNNEQIDFEQLRKRAEIANATITEDNSGEGSENQENADDSRQASNTNEDENQSRNGDNGDITEPDFVDQQQIRKLQNRDREVRSHEQAHATAGGAYTGAPSYSFEVGPDGKKYAVEGEVSVDLSPIKGDPRATIAKLQKVYNAALAPANPSVQDSRVANKAAQLIVQAQSELYANSQEALEQTKRENARVVIDTSDRFAYNEDGEQTENDFDQQIQQTLDAQEQIAPNRTAKIEKAAVVIESLYSNVHQAYEKPSRSQFELTA
ncbi:putative metalloprotease CJM1_0395 family protein [Thalassotalea sediminis]|uniref:putative metalloprotease CJM1_0395 family protein n=1 Tax=Thalassotalea sediminis TaxID=1759089 RepID=UPI0025742B11|nr:putative metalloprotease CJM1_0395 family protein [Thalassotalea sediminis]